MAESEKQLVPFMQRADEVQRTHPRVAYYCRLYALEAGLKLPNRTADTNALLNALFKQLEADKPKAGLGDDDALYMEGFALKIFANADAADRAGVADVSTAKKLYAAFCFLEVLRQFGEPAPELVAKQKYAAWRAAEISGALKKGRVPPPPPGAEEQAAPAADAPAADAPAPAAADDFPRPPAGLAHAPLPPPSPPPPASPAHAFAATPPRSPAGRPSLTATPSPPPGLKPPVLTDISTSSSSSGLPVSALAEAQTAAKVAASALSFDDVPTAIHYLRLSLAALGAAEH